MKSRKLILILTTALAVCLLSNFSVQDGTPHPYQLTYPDAFGKPDIPPDNQMTQEGVWLGRLLFYDSLLSINGKMSCAGCHKQSLSFTDGRPLAIGVFGDTLSRNSMALINLAWGKIFFWNGRAKTIEALVKEPIANPKEMGGLSEAQLVNRLSQHQYYPALFQRAFPNEPISITTVSKAIAQFMRTIVSSLYDAPEDGYKDSTGLERYKVLIDQETPLGSAARVSLMQCKSCHTSAIFGGEMVTKYGNDSIFKATSLMNIRYTAPYFHDGRYKTMREVFQFYNDSIDIILAANPNLDLNQSQTKIKARFTKYDLAHADEIFAAFSDSTINTNPLFSNPFYQKGFSWFGADSTTIK